jgi:hypothetical protein
MVAHTEHIILFLHLSSSCRRPTWSHIFAHADFLPSSKTNCNHIIDCHVTTASTNNIPPAPCSDQ